MVDVVNVMDLQPSEESPGKTQDGWDTSSGSDVAKYDIISQLALSVVKIFILHVY